MRRRRQSRRSARVDDVEVGVEEEELRGVCLPPGTLPVEHIPLRIVSLSPALPP